MMKFKGVCLLLCVLFGEVMAKPKPLENPSVDVCIYGGTSAGVIAAYTASKMGKSVLLIEPGKHLGGMSSGGLGFTDIGNKHVVTGLARDFYRRVGAHYGQLERWIFEPRVAEAVFNAYIEEAGVAVLYNKRVVSVQKNGSTLQEMVLEDSAHPAPASNTSVKAKVFMDCSYEGDLMAKAGVSYTVGRESNAQYHETYNGVSVSDRHQFPDGIDPYVVPGDKKSGLIWGVQPGEVKEKGSGDKKIQAYNFRITLTNDPGNRLPIGKPAHYDPRKYELLIRLKQKNPWKSIKDVFIWSDMPHAKTDINNMGGFSTDLIGMNWHYPEAGYAEREKIWQEHADYTKGLLYFVGHDERVPAFIRNEMLQWGYPKDEYTDNGNWTPQLYIREARRMVGELVMTQQYCEGKEVCEDGIGWAAYTMDSHNCDRQVINGMVKNEGNVEVGGFGPFPIGYRAIVPKKEEAANLFVPVCLSASHIAYGSIRMEPVFMVLGQSAAVAACQAIDKGVAVQEVDVRAVQQQLLQDPLVDGSIPEILDREKLSAMPLTFKPRVQTESDYVVFLYYTKLGRTPSTDSVVIAAGERTHAQFVKRQDIRVEGQTSGEWVKMGTFHFTNGGEAKVTVFNPDPQKLENIEAVLLVPARKDAAKGPTERNTFRPKEIWPDDKGVPINAHGGGIYYENGTYYWFGEHKVAGTLGNSAQVGVHSYSSGDLYNWKDEGIALAVMPERSGSDIEKGCILERPKVIYNAKTRKYVMWFHLEMKGRGYRAARTGVATADRVTGPYRFVHSLRPDAGEWPVNISEASPGDTTTAILKRDFKEGQMARDMALFVDDDGKAYHIHSSEENMSLHIAELSDDYLSFTGKYTRVFVGRFMEASTLFKRNGKYYFIGSGCTGWKPNAARSAVADHIWGPWKELGNPCRGAGADTTYGGQSTYVLKVAGAPDKYIFMADIWRPENAIDGRYMWLPITFEEDKPVIVEKKEWKY